MKNIKKVEKENYLLSQINKNNFRVSIFGSARIQKDDKVYRQVYDIAKELGKEGIDIVTGGGPGLMEAANEGHKAGDVDKKAESIGLTIQLPFEAKANPYLEITQHFQKFSDRLDNFMGISHVAVVMPGGIGTCLEFFYTWQLTQVKHIPKIPIILFGEMWEELIKWIKKYPLKQDLMSSEDLENVHIARDIKEALNIITASNEIFQEFDKNSRPLNSNSYKI